MSELAALPASVRFYMQGYVARGRRLALLRRAGLALTLLLAWVLLCCAADRFLELPAGVRFAALLAGGAALLALLSWPLRLWLARQADWVAVAQEIEKQDPRFDQRLVTVTSRLLGRPEHRGSDEILEHLVYQVDREVSEQHSAALLPLRSTAAPWLGLILTLSAAIGLCFVPGLGLPRLAARFALPFAALAPVTTTTLRVLPGDLDVPQSNPVQIDADVHRLGAGQVWLGVSDDGKTWSRSAMTAARVVGGGDGRYSITLASVDRDMQYFVSGGDARSALYTIRVLRRPAISQFDIRYTYPAYTGKAPLAVSNTDGIIEAPVGTEAQVTITATEPLQLALFTTPGGEKILLGRAGAENIRQGRLLVQKDGHYQLDLISTRDVTGSGPPTTEIRAMPDHPPSIRLTEAGATLRLNPRDILPLSYDALDEYGIDSVSVRVQYGASQSVELPIYPDAGRALAAGPAVPAAPVVPARRAAGEFDLDLAGFPLSVGDVLSIVVSAKDTGGQSTSASPVQVLVSPRSIGPDAFDRMNDLSDAARLADALVDELAAAGKSAEASASDVRQNMASAAAVTQRDRHLRAALESAALARRVMLRAAAHGAPAPLCVAIAAWVDKIQTVSSRVSELLSSQSTAEAAAAWAAGIDVIRDASAQSREIQANLKSISQGERAAAILADRESAALAEKQSAAGDGRAERLKQVLGRMREDVAAAASAIGLDAGASDFDSQVRSKVTAAESVVGSQRVIDFAAIVRDWARASPGQPPSIARERGGEISDRLASAAEAEAVRRDADLVRARDLQLASSAAAVLSAEPPGRMNDLAAALSALQKGHELNRRLMQAKAQQPAPDRLQDAAIREAAAHARQQLEALTGSDPGPGTRSAPPGTVHSIASERSQKAESLAMLAGAESARHKYADAAEADRSLQQAIERLAAGDRSSGSEASAEPSDARLAQQARIEQASQEVSRSMKSAEQIDGLSDGQQKLADETRRGGEESAPLLADRQRGLADQIARMTPAGAAPAAPAGSGSALGGEDQNWRDRAVAAVLAAQVELSAMPQQLTEALAAAEDWRRAAERARTAHRDADTANAEHKPAAARAADQADQDVADALHRLQAAAAPLAPRSAEAIGVSLGPFAPEAAAARAAVADALLPELKSISEALQGDNPDAAARSSAGLRRAIETVEVSLSTARDEIAQRDPLVAAKWFARAAADALRRRPPNYPLALKDQDLTTAALAQAWDGSVHRAAAFRLAELPMLRPLYTPQPINPDGSRLAAAARPGGSAGAAAPVVSRNWLRLTPRDGDAPAATPHQSDPAGYEAALRAYFEALGNVEGTEK